MEAVDNLVSQAKLRVERARARYVPVDIAVRTFKRFSEDDGGTLAAALTYYIFFSIFPLLLFAASVVGFLTLGNQELRDDLVREGLKTVPLLRDALSPEGLATIERHRGTLAVTGLVLALYSGTGAVVALEHALNRIEHIGEEPNWIGKRVRSLAWLVILGVAALVSMGLGTLASFTQEIFGDGSPVAVVLAVAGGFAVGVLMFAGSFKFLPGGSRSWRDVVPGAIIAALAFEVLKLLGAIYLAQGEAARNDTFGAFAAAAALLVIAFLISRITLMAAEVNAVLAERRQTRQASA